MRRDARWWGGDYTWTMSKLKLGNPAPDLMLTTLDGRSVALSDHWGNGRSALLIFLRHLA